MSRTLVEVASWTRESSKIRGALSKTRPARKEFEYAAKVRTQSAATHQMWRRHG
jgi:hypothetical protein